ncbi:MAG: hypothetical protein QXH08_00070 [Candidatus Hadarchaeales archaeon]
MLVKEVENGARSDDGSIKRARKELKKGSLRGRVYRFFKTANQLLVLALGIGFCLLLVFSPLRVLYLSETHRKLVEGFESLASPVKVRADWQLVDEAEAYWEKEARGFLLSSLGPSPSTWPSQGACLVPSRPFLILWLAEEQAPQGKGDVEFIPSLFEANPSGPLSPLRGKLDGRIGIFSGRMIFEEGSGYQTSFNVTVVRFGVRT